MGLLNPITQGGIYMSKLELEVINNYIEWLETPKNRKLKMELIRLKGAFLLKQWQKEKKLNNKYQAQEEIAKLIMAVLYDDGVKKYEWGV